MQSPGRRCVYVAACVWVRINGISYSRIRGKASKQSDIFVTVRREMFSFSHYVKKISQEARSVNTTNQIHVQMAKVKQSYA